MSETSREVEKLAEELGSDENIYDRTLDGQIIVNFVALAEKVLENYIPKADAMNFLEKLEWEFRLNYDTYVCVGCRNEKHQGHSKDCGLGNLLRK